MQIQFKTPAADYINDMPDHKQACIYLPTCIRGIQFKLKDLYFMIVD